MTDANDETLVEQTLSGDVDSYSILIRKYQAAVFALALSIVKNAEDARDLTQESFIKAYINLPTLREPWKFTAWLKRIAWSTCVQWLRDTNNRNSLITEISVSSPETPEDIVLDEELREMISNALEALPERLRLTTLLYYSDGLSYKEIASFQEVPVTTVRSRLHESRKRLKATLAEEVIPIMSNVLKSQAPKDDQEIAELIREDDRLWGEVKQFTVAESRMDRNRVGLYAREAKKLNHRQIDTPHLLLSLLHDRGGPAVKILQRLSVDLECLETEVTSVANELDISPNVDQPLKFTDAAKQILQYSSEEAKKVESAYWCPECRLLALLREENGMAAKALAKFGVTLEKVRELIDPRPVLWIQHSESQLSPNEIDKGIRDLVYLLNEAQFLETSSSCSGHPDYDRLLLHTEDWSKGGISVIPIDDIGPAWDFFESICALLDNTQKYLTHKYRPEIEKDIPHFNRALEMYRQVDAEALYASAIPILSIHFWCFWQCHTVNSKLTSIWNTINRATQEFISPLETLPLVETPAAGTAVHVDLLKRVPHIQEAEVRNITEIRSAPKDEVCGRAHIHLFWNRASVRWGWDFINHIKSQCTEELERSAVKISFRNDFTLNPIIKRDNLQRTREDHIKIWKLTELAAREYLI